MPMEVFDAPPPDVGQKKTADKPDAAPQSPTAIATMLSKLPLGLGGGSTPEEVMKGREDPAKNTIKYALPLVNPMNKAGVLPGMAMAGAIGGGSALAQGKSLGESGWRAVVDAAVDGLLRGAGGFVASKAEKVAEPLLQSRQFFERATKEPMEALRAITPRLAGGRVNVPSLGGRMTPQEAVERLVEKTGPAFSIAREELVAALNALSRGGSRAGDAFAATTLPKRFAPQGTGYQRMAEKLMQGARSPVTRGAVDVTSTTQPFESSAMPAAAIPFALGAEGLGSVAGRIHRGMGRVLESGGD